MTIHFSRALTMVAALLAVLHGAALAQASDKTNLVSNAELSDIYSRLELLESSAAAGHAASGSASINDSGACCDDCCRAGLVAGGEVVWLKAYHGDGVFGDFNWDEGFRAWLGYQRDDGLGVRVRYFDFDQVADNGDRFGAIHADLEIYDTVQVGCNWDVAVGAGVRYADITFDDAGGTSTEKLYGVGPVVTAEVYRHVHERAALYAIGRQSILAGDEGRFENQPDSTIAISEIQMGAQVHRSWNGALLFGRVGWEAHYYYDLLNASNTGATLMGGSISAGLVR